MGCCNDINITSIYNVVGIKLNSLDFDGTDSTTIYCENEDFKIDISIDDPGPKYRRFAHPPQLSTEGYWRSKCDFNNTLLIKDNIKYLVGAANNYDTTTYNYSQYIKCSPDNTCINNIGFDYYLEMYINDNMASGFPKHYIDNKAVFYGTDAPSFTLGCGCNTSERSFSINWSDYKLKTGDKIEVYAVPSGEYSYPAFVAVAEDIPYESYSPASVTIPVPYSIPYTPCATSLQFINGSLSKTLVDTWIWPNIDAGKYDLSNNNLVGSIDCFLDSDIDIVLPSVNPPPKKYKIKISLNYLGTSANLIGMNNNSDFNPFICGVPIDPKVNYPPNFDPGRPIDIEYDVIMRAVSSLKENLFDKEYSTTIQVNQNESFFNKSYGSYSFGEFIYKDPSLKTDQKFNLSIFYEFEYFLNIESESDVLPEVELAEGSCFKANLKDYGYSYKINVFISLSDKSSLFRLPICNVYHTNGSFISKNNFRCKENIEPLSSIMNFNVGINYPQGEPIFSYGYTPLNPVSTNVNISFKPNVEIEEVNE